MATIRQQVEASVADAPKHLPMIYSFVLRRRPGTAPETIRARIYEALKEQRIRRLAPGLYFASSGPASLFLVEGDARDLVSSLDDSSVDAIITDPPYDLGTKKHALVGTTRPHLDRGRSYRQWDLDRAMLQEFFRVLRKDRRWNTINPKSRREGTFPKGGSAMLLFAPNISRSTWKHIHKLIDLAEEIGFEFLGTITWDQEVMGMGYDVGRNQKAEILFFTAGPRNGLLWDLGMPNILRARRVPRRNREHEAEKPVRLFSKLVGAVTVPGDVVLDPFAGRGRWIPTVLRKGRHVIAGEIDPVWIRSIQGDFATPLLGSF